MKQASIELQKAYLISIKHINLQEKIKKDRKRKRTSRKSIYKGGSSAATSDLKERIQIRTEAERVAALRKAEKTLQAAINKHNKLLKEQGIAARRANRAKRDRVQLAIARNSLLAPEDLILDREPDKAPTTIEDARLTREGHLELFYMVLQLEAELKGETKSYIDFPKPDLLIKTNNSRVEQLNHDEFRESSPIEGILQESSDVESNARSIDSIQKNADFSHVI
ncbi:hypothetical protein MBM_00552 [Drepanopeziza brunnea f. sp. 'multigermtubi' MB_m1]|uniref:Uncharacterized protein n=1 Tax=Marssonina brunnea f. sp. multigermtubi (strain MB_m1) TaxID=1072389 RepID=K1Y8E7_MARBU|nr:uncharacterized protein MBM_00552 [Drepanopeziza brunnea f. sp. 'multigermtubi' MB_m1]EKD21439.1 hypothetical protein MBM_00552 [Drepanopeziza brunnea f. sp. 'multigermtubi' MB_m1]